MVVLNYRALAQGPLIFERTVGKVDAGEPLQETVFFEDTIGVKTVIFEGALYFLLVEGVGADPVQDNLSQVDERCQWLPL